MQFTTSLLEKDNEISYRILKSIISDVEPYFKNIAKDLTKPIQDLVRRGITTSIEYQSLVSGRLKYEFGLPDADSRIENLLNIWNNISMDTTKPKIKGNQITASLNLYMIKSDYSDVLASASSKFKTENGDTLNWLEWLLLLGDKTIIKNYEFVLGPNRNSRTGKAVMKETVSGKWKVPSQYSGSAGRNWITRVLDSISQDIDNVVYKALQ